MGIATQLLMRVSRIYGIHRWPYRKLHSLESLRKAVEEDESVGSKAREVKTEDNAFHNAYWL